MKRNPIKSVFPKRKFYIIFFLFSAGFLGSFLSNSLKTNQLEVNTDARTLRPVARLKEPRDLFALPKERDNDCSQQAPRWPNECQVRSNENEIKLMSMNIHFCLFILKIIYIYSLLIFNMFFFYFVYRKSPTSFHIKTIFLPLPHVFLFFKLY